MKFYQTIILAIFSHALIGTGGWFLNEWTRTDNTGILEQQIEIIEKQKESLLIDKRISKEKIELLKDISFVQREAIDSLIQRIAEVEKTIEIKQVEIDSLIALDSTKVVAIYRIALENLGIIPDMSERLTLREIAWGAKYLTQVPQLMLKINLQDRAFNDIESLISTKNNIIIELEHLNTTEKRITEQSELQSDLYKAAYAHATRFWANRIIISAGVGVSYLTNKTFEPSVFVGIGFKLWSNE